MFVFGFTKFRIKVTGFEPMALCTQNSRANQTALHFVSPQLIPMKTPSHYAMNGICVDEHQNQPLASNLFGPELALTFFPSFAMLR